MIIPLEDKLREIMYAVSSQWRPVVAVVYESKEIIVDWNARGEDLN